MKQHEQAMILMEKALHDEVLVEEVFAAKRVTDDIVGFHCQQAMEKLLKAALSHHGVRYRKIHDLREIMDILTDAGHPLPGDLEDIDSLSPYGSLFRYDVIPSNVSLDRQKALDMVRRLRKWVEQQIRD